MFSINNNLRYYYLDFLISKKNFKIFFIDEKFLRLPVGYVRICSTRELDFYKYLHNLFYRSTLLQILVYSNNYNRVDIINTFCHNVLHSYFFIYYFILRFKVKILKYYIFNFIFS